MTDNFDTQTQPNLSQLEPEVIECYRRDGFVRLPRFFDAQEVGAVAGRIDPVVRDVVPRMDRKDYVLEPVGQAVRNLWRLEHYDPFFAELGNSPRAVSIIEQLLGATPSLSAVETFNKPARQGSSVPAHQDNAYFCQEPPDMLTVWVAIDPTTAANGPVNYVAESKDELLPHKGSGIPGNSMPPRIRPGASANRPARSRRCDGAPLPDGSLERTVSNRSTALRNSHGVSGQLHADLRRTPWDVRSGASRVRRGEAMRLRRMARGLLPPRRNDHGLVRHLDHRSSTTVE